MTRTKHYDVIIIGGGMTGLSTAYALLQNQIKNIAILSSPNIDSMTQRSPDLFYSGYGEHFTRLEHALGLDAAKSIWRFSDDAFLALKMFCLENKIEIAMGDRLRLATSEAESRELKKATELLNKIDILATFHQSDALNPLNISTSARVQSLSIETQKGATTNITQLISTLKNLVDVVPRYQSHVKAVKSTSDEIKIDAGRQNFSAEMVVLAGHFHTETLCPGLQETLIPFSDQFHRYQLKKNLFPVGTVFSANFGYEWGAQLDKEQIIFGGGRFLRAMAGIGDTSPYAHAKATTYLHKMLMETFALEDSPAILETESFLGCLPCDEQAIIGPMFGEPRILIAAGFGSASLSFSFYAGVALAKIIALGECPELPKAFLPMRLRSL